MDGCIGTQKFFMSGLTIGFDRLSKQDLTARVAFAAVAVMRASRNQRLDRNAMKAPKELSLAMRRC